MREITIEIQTREGWSPPRWVRAIFDGVAHITDQPAQALPSVTVERLDALAAGLLEIDARMTGYRITAAGFVHVNERENASQGGAMPFLRPEGAGKALRGSCGPYREPEGAA